MRLRVITGAGVVALLAFASPASAAPPAPFTLTAPVGDARVDTRTPTLTWERSAGATRYEVRIDEGGVYSETGVVEDADCATTCSFAATKLLASSPHRWKVIASNAEGTFVTGEGAFVVDVPPKILTFHVAAPSFFHGLGPAVSVVHGPYCPRAVSRPTIPSSETGTCSTGRTTTPNGASAGGSTASSRKGRIRSS